MSKLERSNWFTNGIPWQFRLLLIMVTVFFVGGLLLDYRASDLTPKLGDDSSVNGEILKLINKKHEALTTSAALLYDFAKIALGALIASVTQHLKVEVSD